MDLAFISDIRIMRNKKINILILLTLVSLLVSCIKNDIPYPKIQQNILALAVQNEVSSATIDPETMTAEVHLPETEDIKKVKFTEFKYTEGAEVSRDLLFGTYDLSTPIKVVLSRYQSYEWIISATQEIERYFSIAGQVGETVIDAVGHRIIVYVPDNLDKKELEITALKLGPEGKTTISPNLKLGKYDFSKPVHVTVSYFEEKEDWTIYVDTTTAIVTTTQADAWSKVIWVYGNAPEGADNGFQYRAASASEWIDVPKESVIVNGGAFKVCIPHLYPLTEYVVRAISGENLGNEISVTTDAVVSLPDASFNDWWQDDKIWNPWKEGSTQFWDTGNKGAATLGQSNVVPSDYVPNGITGKSAKLETKFVGIAGIGKLAAGSIYSGVFKKVDGTNGILGFGREWTTRPTKLKGYFQYTTAPVNYASTEFKHLIDKPDTCHIYIALTDWDEPYEIRTNPKNRQIFDRNSPAIIAYGELLCGESTDGFEEFEIELNYRATNRKPKYILVTSAASKYGDFFTGGAGAVLYVDEFKLEYDY